MNETPSQHKFDPYLKRPINFLDQVESEGWRMKVYGISPQSTPLPKEVATEGMAKVLPHLPQPHNSEHRYGVGFLIIHHGVMRNWYLLDWWGNEDILHHKLFSSPLDEPGAITRESDKSLLACVHELRIISFESEAWIKTVLGDDEASGFDQYLDMRYE